ncbi:MAG: type I methionyl aminopeptidase, partial [Candidatus Nealsonbacteria bacterium]
KTPEEIEIMAEGGKMLAGIMKELGNKIRPGITTNELNRAATALVLNFGGKPSFLGYQGYPAALCTSINEEIVHSIPSERILKEGDIVSLDLGLEYKGFHTDMARTFPVAKVSSEAKKLIKVTKEAFERGFERAKIGNSFGDISQAVQKYVEGQGFGVIRELCGHGIGREVHEDPQVLNYGEKGTGPKIKEGMVFCLEPMVAVGHWRLEKTKDGHGFKTKDNSLSCHFEDTIAVLKDGVKILTVIE